MPLLHVRYLSIVAALVAGTIGCGSAAGAGKGSQIMHHAYVVAAGNGPSWFLVPLDLATDALGAAISLLAGGSGGFFVSPDDMSAFLVDDNGILPVSLSTQTSSALLPFPTAEPGLRAYPLLSSPDGQTIYLLNAPFNATMLVPFNLRERTFGRAIELPPNSDTLTIVLAKDGKTAYVQTYAQITSNQLFRDLSKIVAPDLATWSHA